MTIKERIDALWDKNGAVHATFPSVANAAKYLKDLLELPENIAHALVTPLEAKDAELKKKYEDTEYIRLRVAAYPSIADQFDTIFHNGVDSWKADIQAIKDLYPKPQGS